MQPEEKTAQNAIKTLSEATLRIQALSDRLNLSDAAFARYLGSPVQTVRKWRTGERVPSASTMRLLEVLAMVEMFAPELHVMLCNPREE